MAQDEAGEALPPELAADLEALALDATRPLLAVDADEVLVHFAGHLAHWVAGLGYEMRLERYALEGAIRVRETGQPVPFADAIGLIDRFFAEESHAQQAIEGAAAALGRLSRVAQVVVLTNVPLHARATRVETLGGLGMPYPLVANTGGKGRALAWMAARTGRPAAFVDDSPSQIASAAAEAPDVVRVHFAGAEFVARVLPEVAEADHRAGSWEEAEAVLARLFG